MNKSVLTFVFILLCFISYPNSKPNIDSLRKELHNAYGENKLEILKTIMHNHLIQSSYDSCIFYGQQTIHLAQEMNLPEDEAYARRRVGYAYQQLGSFNKSISHFERAFELFQDAENELKVAIIADLLCRSYNQTSNYISSMEYFIIGEKIGNELKNDTSYSNTTVTRYFSILYTNAGILYFNLDSNERALHFFHQALVNADRINDTTRMAASYSNIGMVLEKRKQYSEAISMYKKALNLNRITGNKKYESTVLMNIAIVFDSNNQPDSAKYYYDISLEIAENKGYKDIISSVHQNLGSFYSSKKEYKDALYHHRKSIAISNETDFYTRILKNYFEISNIWKTLNVYDSALYYNELYHNLKDEIQSEEVEKEIADLDIKYKTQKKQQENTILKKDIEISNKIRFGLIVGIITLIIIAVLVTLLLLTKSKTLKQKVKLLEQEKKINTLALEKERIAKKRANDQLSAEKQINRLNKEKLEQKHRELSTVTLHIMNKNVVLNSMYDEIEKHKNNLNNSDIDICISKLSNIIQSNLEFDKNWQQFKMHFEEVYHGFFEKLNSRFPVLTTNDHKLCAYIKMNLNSKEIAQMLNISAASVDKSRNRLRKKLELPTGIKLYDFINNFHK